MGMYQLARRTLRPVGVLVVVALLAACSSGDAASTTSPSEITSTPGADADISDTEPTDDPGAADDAANGNGFDPAAIPGPPPAFVVESGTEPVELAETLAVAVDSENEEESLAAWLAAYDALQIPVLDPAGTALGTTEDDPVGPGWWQVWSAAGIQRVGAGVSLDDVARLITGDESDSNELAAAILEDLSAGAAPEGGPLASFLTTFVSARSELGKHPVDFLAGGVTPDQVILDTATAQMITWLAVRLATVGAAIAGTQPSGFVRAGAAGGVQVLARAPAPQPTPCSQAWGSEQTTYWINWVINKIGSGVEIAGVGQFKSIFEQIAKLDPSSSDLVERATKLAAKVNVVTSVLSLVMQLNALNFGGNVDPNPLVRTKRTTEDKGIADHRIDIFLDATSLPDGNNPTACTVSWLLNAAGISFTFPPAGPIAGAEVTVVGTQGFAQGVGGGGYVELINADPNKNFSSKMTTDDRGAVEFKVQAKRQKSARPETADEWSREYTYSIKSQAGEVGGNNMLGIFFDGLTATGAASAVTAAVDIAQTLSWNVGEGNFELTDWISGYSINAVNGGVSVTGTVCDFAQPFRVHYTIDEVSADSYLTFAPGGQADLEGQMQLAVPVSLTGSGSWAMIDNPDGNGILVQTDFPTIDAAAGGESVSIPPPIPLGPFPFTPIEGECPGNS